MNTEQKALLMDAEDISSEIYGGKISARNINERYSYQPGFPECVRKNGINGKKFWRRSEILKYYGAEMETNAA